MPDDLIVSDLAKRYGPRTALAGINFSVARGEIFGLLGRNGAGKTTAIECIVGLRKPDAGMIQLLGIDALNDPAQAKQCFGVQLQSTALYEKITPREAIHLFGSFYPKRAVVGALLERFQLGEKADACFDTLSDGQRQRLALALAFVNEPQIVFLDEPTAGLDVQSRRQLQNLIRDIRGQGRTIVLSTHYIEEAQSLCDRIAITHQGKIVASGSPAALMARAGTPALTLEDVFIQLTGGLAMDHD